jgi:hypothetical protein
MSAFVGAISIIAVGTVTCTTAVAASARKGTGAVAAGAGLSELPQPASINPDTKANRLNFVVFIFFSFFEWLTKSRGKCKTKSSKDLVVWLSCLIQIWAQPYGDITI